MATTATKRMKIMDDVPTNAQCINTIRCLAADTVQKADSGHPGAPMGCAPMAHLLFGEFMTFSPSNPKWHNRDRFVLSNGHACALQYCMLHLLGYDVSLDDLKSFRQLHSKTPGHPENHLTPGIEVSTGPLGQGISNAVGLAIAEAHLAKVYNRENFPIVDHHTYVICGDGCLQEGVSAESASLAGHLGLGKIIVLYDDNNIQIDGETELAFTEDVLKRYEAYGWHTQTVSDGNGPDMTTLREAVLNAKAVTDKPSIIKVRTFIGFGSTKQKTEKVHGSPLGAEDIAQLKKRFGFNPDESFAVSSEVYAYYAERKAAGEAAEAAWNEMFAQYSATHPALAEEYTRVQSGGLPAGWTSTIPSYKPADKKQATRKASQAVLASIVPQLPELMGGSADLTPSTLTKVKGNEVDFQKATPEGRYLRFGVREHAMAAICNGLAAHGGVIPFASTFLNFTGYALGAVRLSALSNFRVLYIMTHDSIGLGEDGPTHQPIEMLASLRSMPNMLDIRPADANETGGAYICAIENTHGPTTIALTRQDVANLPNTSFESVKLGAYTIVQAANPQVILTGSGSEVELAVKAAALLKDSFHIEASVVSFPSFFLFEKQSYEYKRSVFPEGVPVLSVEAASPLGWARYSHYQVAMTTFGVSAPAPAAFKHFGFTPENVAEKAAHLVEFFKGKAPTLIYPF